MYRLQVHDARTTGMHWQIGKGGGFHYAVAEARGEALPVTVFLGGPPALILAAIAPLPENVPELMLASLLPGSRLALVFGAGAPAARGERGVRPGGLRPSGRAAARRTLRRPLRLLLAPARLSRLPRRAPPRIAATPSIPPPSWASPDRRTSSSAISCRSCSRRSSRWSCPRWWTSGRTARRDITRWRRRS